MYKEKYISFSLETSHPMPFERVYLHSEFKCNNICVNCIVIGESVQIIIFEFLKRISMVGLMSIHEKSSVLPLAPLHDDHDRRPISSLVVAAYPLLLLRWSCHGRAQPKNPDTHRHMRVGSLTASVGLIGDNSSVQSEEVSWIFSPWLLNSRCIEQSHDPSWRTGTGTEGFAGTEWRSGW